MAFSYCWRYACLPAAFSLSPFSATVTRLEALNINAMPGGNWSAVVKRTAGVNITVTGHPKPLSSDSDAALPADVVFNESGAVVLPVYGVYDLTFEYSVPVG